MSEGPAEKPQVIQLTRRDIDDAKRLLALLSGAQGKLLIGADDKVETPSLDGRLQQRGLDLLARRRKRHSLFGKAMFGEPAWEMLLLLYAIGPRESVSRLAELALLSKSTATRWIDYLEGQRLVRRDAHPKDKRAIFVELTEKGRDSISLYLSETLESED